MAKMLVLLAGLLIGGCAAQVKHNTPSGKPEVTIGGKVGASARAIISGAMLDGGYNMRAGTDALLIFDKKTSGIMASMLFGSGYDSVPSERITYTVLEGDRYTRIVASMAMVTNPGSAFERITPMDGNENSVFIQQLLLRTKTVLEADAQKAAPAGQAIAAPKPAAPAKIGKQQYSAGTAASAAGCANPELASAQYGVEFYRVGCDGGSRMVRCEWQQCAMVE